MNGREIRHLAQRLAGVGPQDRQQPGNAIALRRTQYRKAVVDKQGTLRVERFTLLQVLPECRILLGDTEIVGGDHLVEVVGQAGALHLQPQALHVGIGHQYQALPLAARLLQKLHDMGMYGDKVLHFAFQQFDIQLQLAPPVVHAVPLDGSLHGAIARCQLLLRRRQVDAAALRIALRHMLQPEVVVEVEVEQRSIHIEKDAVDGMPVDHTDTLCGPWQRVPSRGGQSIMVLSGDKRRARTFLMREKPQILTRHTLAKTRLFHIEELELRFANGVVTRFERLLSPAAGAVLVVPVQEDGSVLLVREYAAGVDRYELAFPKGRIEPGEEILAAAQREMTEEVGHGARRLRHITSLTLAPGYIGHQTHVVLAQELYPERNAGDEPEEIEVVSWPLDRATELLLCEDFTEARSIAALFMVRELLQHG